MTHDEWLRTISPHLFVLCERCGIEARNHDDGPTEICPGFWRNPMELGATKHGEDGEIFRNLRSVG